MFYRLISLPTLIVLSILGRIDAQSKDGMGLYQLSMIAYLEAKTQRDGPTNHIVVMDNNVLHDPYIREHFPSTIGSSAIEYLTRETLQQRCRRTGKGIPIIELLPMRQHQDVLIVRCAEYRASIRHRKLILGAFGGCKAYWRFDCAKNEYVKIKVEPFLAFVL